MEIIDLPPLVQRDVILAPFTYYKIGGPSRFFAQPESVADLECIADLIQKHRIPYFILGSGSNVLMADEGFEGLVIQTSKLNRTLRHEGNQIAVGCSASVAQVLRYCGQQGLGGLEFLVGVPGNIGGVLVMNAGTKTGEATKVVREITTFNLETKQLKVIPKAELIYTYRTQHFLAAGDIVLGGLLEVHPIDPKTLQDTVAKLLTERKAAQPIDKPSCGSVFKNPNPKQGQFAWKLISEAGLKGVRRGNAQISELHANFIINLGGAKSSDVRELIELAKTTVQNRFGIILEEEVKIIPFSQTS